MTGPKGSTAMRSRAKVMIITGGAGGIGAAIAAEAVARGYRVIVADIDVAGARSVAAPLGDKAEAVELDVTDAGRWEGILETVWSDHGGLDVLVNNAAVIHPGRVERVPLAAHQATVEVNLMGPVKGMLAALPRFKRQGHGHFVTVCSGTSFFPFPGIASYAAAKHALRAFHHTLALEERRSGLDFTIVHPPATETPMLDRQAETDDVTLAFAGEAVTPAAVAKVVLDATAKRTLEVIMPAEQARRVKTVGTSPRSMRRLIDAAEELGRQKLHERRTRTGQSQA